MLIRTRVLIDLYWFGSLDLFETKCRIRIKTNSNPQYW